METKKGRTTISVGNRWKTTPRMEVCGLTVAADGSEDQLIYCFKEGQPCQAGREMLLRARQQAAAVLQEEEESDEEQQFLNELVIEKEDDDEGGEGEKEDDEWG
ncbi:uncharacterized protein LOC133631936 [Entelurus aequoreus]|uniref:uncharacterized protein LOC133631936 n=1 Tax=Entelurus aequoreus TaxID=161455 RepID=UPI002B1E1F7A|nr:uncharacterized protein LOC133631936 [Entelurus aequoreus]